MTRGFPKVQPSALAGEAGVNLVAGVVNAELGWMFRRTHNEHDFGIDGYFDVVSASEEMTGRSLAVQIKYGRSYTSCCRSS
jgi:hypothetical protein